MEIITRKGSCQVDYLLVNPSSSGVYQTKQEQSSYPALEPPYLALLTAEVVRNHGYGVELLDANAENLSAEETARQIHDRNPRYTHLIVHGNQPSASSQLMDWVSGVCGMVKESGSETKIVLSGTHPAALPRETLTESRCDFVAGGEGFRTALGLTENLPLSEVQGLWYRENGKILRGKDEKLIEPSEMAQFFPKGAWDIAPMDLYRAHDWHCLDNIDERQPYASMYTSFGCPYKCSFCCINSPFTSDRTVAPRIRCRDVGSVVDEIEMLVEKYGIKNLKLIDEMYVLDQRHYTGIAKGLIERGLGNDLNIWAYARVDTVKEGHLDTLRKAGINWLVLGIESGSKHVRDGVTKGRFNESDVYGVVRKIQNAGIRVLGNYIFGLPDDNNETMNSTLHMAEELNCDRPNFYSAMAYPGSYLHVQAKNTSKLLQKHGKEAIEMIRTANIDAEARKADSPYLYLPSGWDLSRALLPEERELGGPGWIGYSQHSYHTWNLPTEHLMPEQVLAFRDNVLSTYFVSKRYTDMIKQKFGERTAEMFCKVNAEKPKRKLLGHML